MDIAQLFSFLNDNVSIHHLRQSWMSGIFLWFRRAVTVVFVYSVFFKKFRSSNFFVLVFRCTASEHLRSCSCIPPVSRLSSSKFGEPLWWELIWPALLSATWEGQHSSFRSCFVSEMNTPLQASSVPRSRKRKHVDIVTHDTDEAYRNCTVWNGWRVSCFYQCAQRSSSN